MNQKKLTAVIAACVLAISCTACGNKAESSNTSTTPDVVTDAPVITTAETKSEKTEPETEATEAPAETTEAETTVTEKDITTPIELTAANLETEYDAAYGGLVIKSCKYAEPNPIIIPAQIGNDSVKAIGQGVFGECTASSVTLPDGLLVIGLGAFDGYSSAVKEVIIPNTVTTIEQAAFHNTKVETITLPGSITNIGPRIFEGSKALTDVTFEEGFTEISEYMFIDSALQNVTFKGNLTKINDGAFMQTQIENITIPATDEFGIGIFEDCQSLKTVTLEDGCQYISLGMFRRCKNLESVTIPDSVTTIGEYAFIECESLRELTIPENTVIGRGAFNGCTALTIHCGGENYTYANAPEGWF